MRFNKKFDLDFPEEVFDYDNNLITYKTSAGEFRYKNEIRKYKKKNINPTILDNTIPISGYEIRGFNNIRGTSGGQGRATVTIKHPITGHKFVMTADNFYIDVINKLEIKNGVIQSKCFLGFDRYERLFPIRLIIENDPLILGASLELTTKKPSSPNKLVIGARCKSKNYGEVIYVGPISKGALVETDFDGSGYPFDRLNIYKKTSTRLYLFQKCNDPDTLCIETWIGKGTIEKIIDPNAGTNLSIDTIKQSILSENNCLFDHIEPIRDNSKAEKYTITYRDTAYYDHKLFMYQESPKKIIIVQRLRATYCDGKTAEKYLLRGEVICNVTRNEVRLNPYKSKNDSGPDYYISLTTSPNRLHDVFDEFTGDIQKLVPIRSNAHLRSLGYSYRTNLNISDLHPCIRILDKQGKEIPHFDDIRVNNGHKIEINVNLL